MSQLTWLKQLAVIGLLGGAVILGPAQRVLAQDGGGAVAPAPLEQAGVAILENGNSVTEIPLPGQGTESAVPGDDGAPLEDAPTASGDFPNNPWD